MLIWSHVLGIMEKSFFEIINSSWDYNIVIELLLCSPSIHSVPTVTPQTSREQEATAFQDLGRHSLLIWTPMNTLYEYLRSSSIIELVIHWCACHHNFTATADLSVALQQRDFQDGENFKSHVTTSIESTLQRILATMSALITVRTSGFRISPIDTLKADYR